MMDHANELSIYDYGKWFAKEWSEGRWLPTRRNIHRAGGFMSWGHMACKCCQIQASGCNFYTVNRCKALVACEYCNSNCTPKIAYVFASSSINDYIPSFCVRLSGTDTWVKGINSRAYIGFHVQSEDNPCVWIASGVFDVISKTQNISGASPVPPDYLGVIAFSNQSGCLSGIYESHYADGPVVSTITRDSNNFFLETYFTANNTKWYAHAHSGSAFPVVGCKTSHTVPTKIIDSVVPGASYKDGIYIGTTFTQSLFFCKSFVGSKISVCGACNLCKHEPTSLQATAEGITSCGDSVDLNKTVYLHPRGQILDESSSLCIWSSEWVKSTVDNTSSNLDLFFQHTDPQTQYSYEIDHRYFLGSGNVDVSCFTSENVVFNDFVDPSKCNQTFSIRGQLRTQHAYGGTITFKGMNFVEELFDFPSGCCNFAECAFCSGCAPGNIVDCAAGAGSACCTPDTIDVDMSGVAIGCRCLFANNQVYYLDGSTNINGSHTLSQDPLDKCVWQYRKPSNYQVKLGTQKILNNLYYRMTRTSSSNWRMQVFASGTDVVHFFDANVDTGTGTTRCSVPATGSNTLSCDLNQSQKSAGISGTFTKPSTIVLGTACGNCATVDTPLSFTGVVANVQSCPEQCHGSNWHLRGTTAINRSAVLLQTSNPCVFEFSLPSNYVLYDLANPSGSFPVDNIYYELRRTSATQNQWSVWGRQDTLRRINFVGADPGGSCSLSPIAFNATSQVCDSIISPVAHPSRSCCMLPGGSGVMATSGQTEFTICGDALP